MLRSARLAAVLVVSGAAAAAAQPAPPELAPWPGIARDGPASPACADLPPPRALTLLLALRRVACQHPSLRQAVLLADEQRAQLELAQLAFRPRFSASAELAANRIPSSNSAAGSLASSVTGYLGMSWTLLDFGQREASVRQARAQVASAEATQQAAALGALNEALRLYVEAAAAQARLAVQSQAEQVARQSLAAAQARHEAAVGSLAERLQAETALAQATLERVRAQGAWLAARGSLALALGLPVQDEVTLAPPQDGFPHVGDAQSGSPEWIAQARAGHPRVRALRADVEALRARLDAVRADGRGSVAISAGVGSTRDLAGSGGRFEQDLSGSVVAAVPLFNAAEQRAREAQVLAQAGARGEALRAAEREVEGELWRGARQLESEAENLRAARALAATAERSHEIALGRYRAGVGPILELLAAQAALANARTQAAQAELSYAQARLGLAVVSGRILALPQ